MSKVVSSEHRRKIIETAAENARKLRDYDRLLAMVDALLSHCDKEGGECSVCSQIVCPHKDPMHFHHDGCPSCVTAVETSPVPPMWICKHGGEHTRQIATTWCGCHRPELGATNE